MIVLRKMNNERFLVNHNQIECIELIPECKIVMMNHDYYLVKDTVEEIIQKIADYNAKDPGHPPGDQCSGQAELRRGRILPPNREKKGYAL